MRILNGVFCVLMLAFAAVQVNDPDYVLWMAIYLMAAFWAGLAAWRPAVFAKRPVLLGLAASLAAAIGGTLAWWPPDSGWWRQEVWWQSELAREGMGLMVVTLVLLLVALTAWLRRRPA